MTILSRLPLIFWIAFWTYWFISAFRSKKSVRTRSWWFRSFGIRLVILAIVIYALNTGHGGTLGHFFYALNATTTGNVFLSALGVVLCAAGIAFAIWARVYLGRNWGMPMTLREKPELVTSGPYQFVRHPIYTGFLLAVLGTALTDGAIWFLVLILAGIYFIYSAMTEEKMMLKEFPDQYPAYMKKTKMFIPFIL